MANELKPCPFCGSEPSSSFTDMKAVIKCEPCGFAMEHSTVIVSLRVAEDVQRRVVTKRWNARPAAPVEGLERYAPRPCDEMQDNIGMDRHKYGEYVRYDQAEVIIAAKDAEILAMRRAIMNGDPDLVLRHESFIEMAATLHRACDGGRERAEKAEADKAALAARVARDDAAFQELIKLGKEADTKFEALETELAAARKAARAAHDTLIEINPYNYNHDDVCQMNDASVEAIFLLADVLGETHGKTAEWWELRRAALEVKP